MRGSMTSLVGAVALAGALAVAGSGVAYAGTTPAAQSAQQAQKAHKVKVTAKGGTDVRVRPQARAGVVAHLGLGAFVWIGGPTLVVHGVLWLHLSGGGWICARDVSAP